ncbi:phage tail tape measure protein [Chitinophaga sp. Hz27]|uniref:phage tail tape measure protein n=1 Tax=Chitinophaga sp. Hz27 TaxID=3347169 RepID=UPI0035DA1AA1
MAVGIVEKIYQVKSRGIDELIQRLRDVNGEFERVRISKQAALDLLNTTKDVAQAKKLTEELRNLRIEEAELRVERQRLMNEAKAQQAIRQAEITQREQQRTFVNEELQKQAELRTARDQTMLQIKQEQLQRQQSITQLKTQKDAYLAAASGITAVKKEASELYKAIEGVNPGSPVSFRGNTLQYDEAIAKLKQLMATEQDFRRQFSKDGLLVAEYTSGIVQAFKSMGLDDLIGGQITKANGRLQLLNSEFNTLKTELSEIRVTGQGSLDTIEKKLVENRQEALQLQQQVGQLQKEFRGMGDIGNQITTGIAQGFKEMKGQLAQFVIGYFGFQAVLSGGQKLIQQNYELSDSIARIKIYTKSTTSDVNDLVDSLKKLDTRTSLSGLVDVATIVAKKGVAREEIVGVTQALDQLFVVLGKEVGDPHEAVSSLVKLVNVYSHDQHVTANNISDIGAAIAKLTSSGVATGRFLIDFSERMAGIRGITGLTIDKVLGLGAALEELGQRSEVSATALSQLVVKLFTDSDKYAKIAGKSVDEFNKLLRDSPIDAFVMVAEKLKGNAGEMEKFFEGVSDLHVKGGRIIGVLGDIAGNADYARKRLADASKAMGDQAALASAFKEKNETFAATLDKIAKKFEVLGSNRAVQATLLGIASVITFFLGNLPTLITLLGLWATGWAILNKEVVISRAQLLLLNAQIFAGRVALAALTILQNAYAVSVGLLTGAYRGATIAATLFNSVIRITPLGIILTALGLLAGALAVFAATTTGTTEALKAHAAQLRVNGEITAAAKAQTEGITNRIAVLTKVVRDNTASLGSRQQALKDLIAIAPEYLGKLTLENIKTSEGKAILDGYIQSLRKKAELQAGESIANKAIEERTQLEKTLYDLEVKRSQGKTGKRDLSDAEASYLPTSRKIPFGAAVGSIFGNSTVDAAIAGVKDAIAEKNKEIDAANKFLEDKYSKLTNTVNKGEKKRREIRTPQTLKDEIASLDNEISITELGTDKLKQLVHKREALQKEYNDALDKTKEKEYRGAKLSGADRDVLREIDASRDQLLAAEKLKFTKGEEQEEDYLRTILKINQDAIDKKLKAISTGNAAEKQKTAELQLQRITDERETNEKIFQLREAALKNEFEQTKKKAESQLRSVNDNPLSTEGQRAQAKLEADKTILSAQETFNDSMDKLEQELSIDSKKTAEDRGIALQQIQLDINKDQLANEKAAIADLHATAEKGIAEYKANLAKIRTDILSDPSLSFSQKTKLVNKIDKTENVGILAREVADLKTQLPIYQKLLTEKKITETEYYQFLEKIHEKQAALYNAQEDAAAINIKSTTDLLKDGLMQGLGISSEYAGIVGKALAESMNLAQDAMNGYFDAERARIEESKQLLLDRLEIEKNQAKARAQTVAQQQRIDDAYALKKKQAEQKAGEELKKSKKSEAKIALATELANIWATAYQLGPIAGPIAGAAFSLLALGRYALRLREIDSTKFEFGGRAGDVPTRGGRFGGNDHSRGGTPFWFRGRAYESEVNELAVIRTKNAPTGRFTISGSQDQIASALNQIGGGVSFAPGAAVSTFAYGGNLGASLSAPSFAPLSSAVTVHHYSDNTEMIKILQEQAKAIQAVNGRIDRLQVVQDPRTVKHAQDKIVKQETPGTL